MEEILILGASWYDFKGEDGRNVAGCKLTYLTEEEDNGENRVGLRPMTITAPFALRNDLDVVPGIYAAKFRMVPSSDGKKVELRLVRVKFVRPFDLAGLLAGELGAAAD